MKIVLVSDFHLLSKRPVGRIDQILSTQWDKLTYVLKLAESLDGVIVQAGDLFDKPRDWSVLDKFISIKNSFKGVKLLSVYGQHDMYFRGTDSICNMSILEKMGLIKILGGSITSIGIIEFVGCSFGEEVPKFISKPKIRILVIHAPISNQKINIESTPAELFLMEHKDYSHILCGDIHTPFIVSKNNRYILNTGCIVRHTRDEVNKTYKPFVFILDTNTNSIETHYIPSPDYEDAFMEKRDQSNQPLNDFLDDIIENQLHTTNVIRNLMQVLSSGNISNEVKDVIIKLLNDQEVE